MLGRVLDVSRGVPAGAERMHVVRGSKLVMYSRTTSKGVWQFKPFVGGAKKRARKGAKKNPTSLSDSVFKKLPKKLQTKLRKTFSDHEAKELKYLATNISILKSDPSDDEDLSGEMYYRDYLRRGGRVLTKAQRKRAGLDF